MNGLDVVEEIARRYLSPGVHVTSAPPPERVDVVEQLRGAVEKLRRPVVTVATADADLADAVRVLSLNYAARIDVIVTDAVPPDRLILVDQAQLDRALTEHLAAPAERMRGKR